jgi:tripartite-type tricarboxylate transporter receptor subunit TctC
MKRLFVTCIAVLALATQAFTKLAVAHDTYPSRPIKIIVPMPAGSAPDIRIRFVAEQLTKLFAEQVVIENRPGGSGIIGVNAVLSATPDGYTLLAAPASTFTILPAEKRALPFDVNRDLIPIGTVMAEGQVVAVSSKLGINSFRELIATARKNPSTITIGTNPAGSLPHLAAKMIVARSKTEITVVPYSSGGSKAAIRDIMGGRIQAVIEGRPGLQGALDSGDLKALAIMTSERVPTMPDLPTAAETLPGVSAVGWIALCAPKGTPAQVVEQVSEALRKALAVPELLKRVEQLGTPFHPLFDTELAHFIQKEEELWRPVVVEH